jgi:hypothetical protein
MPHRSTGRSPRRIGSFVGPVHGRPRSISRIAIVGSLPKGDAVVLARTVN